MLVENEFFDLFLFEETVVLRTKKEGYPLKSFDMITRQFPRLRIQSFPILRKALTEIDIDHGIGAWLPLVEVTVSKDKMTAYLSVNATIEELETDRTQILQLANQALDDKGIIHGRKSVENEVLLPSEPIVIAIGTPPIKGADAEIEYISVPEKKPTMRDDGSANYYEMNFVTPIKEGEWLGHKVPPQDGVGGMDVFGNKISALRGKDKTLAFEKKSVLELNETDKVILRAAHGGALEYVNGKVSVGKQLVVNGDVGPETGSITFEGAVTVTGTVLAGFSVVATGDISVEGNEGVTNAQVIQSSEGDVYVKGGVFGGGETVIEAKGSIFIKHANNCKLYAKEIHVGLYILGSDVIAHHIFLDKSRGKIIGGHIDALFSIECAYAGNTHERPTILQARGVDKELLLGEIQAKAKKLKQRQEMIVKLEGHLIQFEEAGISPSGPQAEAVDKMKLAIQTHQDEILELDQEIQLDLQRLKTAVPAKIEVTKEAYAGTVLQVGMKTTTLHNPTKGIFTLVDGLLNV